MPSFEFATAQQILFGAGKLRELSTLIARHGLRRLMVVSGSKPERIHDVVSLLYSGGAETTLFSVGSEPSLPMLREAVAQAMEFRCDGVVAVGGGSVIDMGKAVAALLRNHDDIFEYLEVIGRGRPLPTASAPCIAIPTTAGTGAEVTRNAVLFSPEHAVKVSLRSPSMLPVAAIVDPELTLALPMQPTAWSGMDALTQLVEPFTSKRANPMTDALCREAIPRAARALPKVFRNGGDLDARSEMALASLFGGLALANSGLGVVHGFAGPLGGMFDAPHGAICAALLPHGIAANIEHLRRYHEPETPAALLRYQRVAALLTGDEDAQPEDAVAFTLRLCRELDIPTLSHWRMTPAQADSVVEKAAHASSMKANPVVLTPAELKALYLRAL